MKKLFIFLLVMKFAGSAICQVNLQTGSATFSLPIFSWQDDHSRLNSVVAINYNSGNGLKVNDVSTNIGQGWNLIGGGVISRMQIGEPDDQKPYEGNGTVEDVTKYPAGYLYNPVSAANGCPEALTKYPLFEDENHIYKNNNPVAADRELDRFVFQINGRSGAFILGKNNGDKGILLEDSKIKIWFVRNESMPGIRTTISAFYIQDENGLTYKFDKFELTKVQQTKYCDANQTAFQTQPTFSSGNVYHEAAFDDNTINPHIITSWYLTEIKDPLTLRTITFSYDIRSINSPAGTSIAYSYSTDKEYAMISHTTSKTQTPVITTINYPDGHQVAFNYGQDRVDLIGDKAMSGVDITYQGRYLSKYQLTNNYFILNRIGTPVSDYQKRAARLCLQSVKKIGVDLKADEPPYIFDYFLGGGTATDNIVPPPFFHIKDIWGYYNGNNSVAYDGTTIIPFTTPLSDLSYYATMGLCFLRTGSSAIALNPKNGYAKNGLLKQIIYPTGGTLSYVYAQNAGLVSGQTRDVGGVHVVTTNVTDGGYSNDCSNPIVTNYNYVDALNQSSLWAIETPVNSISTNSFYEPEPQKWKWWQPGCKYVYKYPGILSREQAITLTGNQQFWLTFSKVMNVVSTIMNIVDIVNLCLAPTGVGAIVAVVLDIIAIVVTAVISCTANQKRESTSTIYYNSDLNNSNPLPVQFKRVEVGTPGNNGKTVSVFTSPDDYPLTLFSTISNPLYSMKQRLPYWIYGLPKISATLNASGNKVEETENFYDYSYKPYILLSKFPPYSSSLFPSCKCLVTKSSSKRIGDWADPNYYNNLANFTKDLISNPDNLKADIYEVYHGRVDLSKSVSRVYNQNSPSQYLEKITDFTVNSKNYEVSRIINYASDGKITDKRITYSCDYNTGLLNTLNQNNIISVPVSSNTTTTKSFIGDPVFLLDEKVTEFTTTYNGNIQPFHTLERRFKEPLQIVDISNSSYKGPGDPSNPIYKETQSFTYDASGNLTGIKDEGNHTVVNIYDYNDKYVVASVVNAVPIVDKLAYTSFETGNYGGWSISGTPTMVNTSAVTGANSLLLNGSNTITASINAAKSYILSYWSNGGPMNVSNGILIKSSLTINGYTYFEYAVTPSGSTVTITNGGTKNIDELRLYPQTSRMRTVTYDPLIGKTSECDENNRITYYEYDELGRLGFIKDDAKNIIKMYEYNYAKKQNGCTANFSNSTVSEIFYKNDCGAGYIGLPFTYTIPAGRYTSTVSQVVVDKQVQYDLDMQGQAAANAQSFGIGCIRQYGNIAKSQAFVKNSCPIGYVGTNVTYTVPANRYFSTVNQAVADALAQAEINANGQAFANTSSNTNCTINTAAQWVSIGLAKCEMLNGGYTGNQITQFKDENPNSPSYNQIQWINTGTTNSTACAAGANIVVTHTNNTGTTAHVTFTNKLDGLIYYEYSFLNSNDIGAGTIPPGVYDISISPLAFIGSYNFSYQIGAATPVNVISSLLTNITINANINLVINGTIYLNTAQSQAFTKSNCPAGFSATVVYSVPAGTYTSTIGQADADAKAQNDINTNGQVFANNNGVCTTPQSNIYLSNNSGYTGYTFIVYIDGIQYQFPANGVMNVLATSVTPGYHTLNFPCGPTSNFRISPNSPIPGCGTNFQWLINGNSTFSFYPSNSFSVNLTSGTYPPVGFCCHGCSYTRGVYSTSSTIGPGSTLYYDVDRTQPVTDQWVYPYANNISNLVYMMNGSGTVLSTTQNCQ